MACTDFLTGSIFHLHIIAITILSLLHTTLQATPAAYNFYSLGGDPTRTCSNVPFKVVPAVSGTYTWTATPTGLCSPVGSSTTGILRCSKPQTYLLVGTPTTGDPLEVRVNVDYCQDLYAWYAVPVAVDNSTSPPTTTIDRDWKNDYMTFRVWVIGQPLGNLTAATPTFNIDQYLQLTSSFYGSVTPTPHDAALTRTFRQMGLVPKIKNNYVEQYDIFYYCNTSVAPSWNEDATYFVFTCNRTTNDRYGYHRALNGTPGVPSTGPFVDMAYQTKLLVSSVGKQDKFGFTVGDSRMTISRPKFSFPSTLDSKTALTWVPDTAIRFAPCNTNFAIMCKQNDGCVYTNDEFTTTFPLNVQLGSLATVKLKDLVVTNSYVIFLTDGSEYSPVSGTLYLIHKNTTTGQTTRMDLSVSAFLGLRTHQWCLSGTQNAVRDGYLAWNNDTVVWGTTTGSPKEYWTQQIRSEWLGSNDTLVDVVLDKTPGRPGFYLMTYGSDGAIGTVNVYYYWKDPGVSAVNYVNLIFTGPWAFNLSYGVPTFNKFRLHTLFGDDPALLVTFTSQMFTASKDPTQTVNSGGKNIAARSYTVNLQAATPTPMMDSTRSARFLTGGSMFFITGNNGIYYGNPIAKKVVLLRKVAPPDSALWVDRFDRPFVITIGGSPLAITQKSYINVDHELINLDDSIPMSRCPYSTFIITGNDPQHHIDVGESFTILGQLWSPVDRRNSISMVLNGPLTITGASQDRWINMTDVSETKVAGDVNEMTRSVVLTNTYAQSFPSFVYRAVSGLPDMVSSLSIHPSKVELSCTKTSQVVVFTQPYCPDGLNIRIVPQNACMSAYPSQISISADYRNTVRNPQDQANIPPNLFCDAPYYGSSYQPQLGLFYFNTLVEMLPVDYYVFENNWRTDFLYSFTETAAGCGKRAQSLGQAMSKPDCTSPVSIISTDGNPCWGPSTYENCFSPSNSNDDKVSSTRPYEILNNSRTNAILFPSDHPTVYVFTAQVLDGNYSFCNLNTTFVVMPQGYGDMPDPLSPLYMFIASIIALIGFFWAVYWVYAISWNENRVGFQMMEKISLPKAWHLITKGEHQLVYTGTDAGKKIFIPKDSM